MDIDNTILDKAVEVETVLSKKTGQRWAIGDIILVAQINVSNDAGEATIANVEVGKCKIVQGVVVPIKLISKKELEDRMNAVKS
jgi:hypothetical protein